MKDSIEKNIIRISTFLILLLFVIYSNAYSEDKFLKVYYEKQDKGSCNFYADNNNFIPYTVKIWFTELLNLTPSKKLPCLVIVPGREKKHLLLSLAPVKGKKRVLITSTVIIQVTALMQNTMIHIFISFLMSTGQSIN